MELVEHLRRFCVVGIDFQNSADELNGSDWVTLIKRGYGQKVEAVDIVRIIFDNLVSDFPGEARVAVEVITAGQENPGNGIMHGGKQFTSPLELVRSDQKRSEIVQRHCIYLRRIVEASLQLVAQRADDGTVPQIQALARTVFVMGEDGLGTIGANQMPIWVMEQVLNQSQIAIGKSCW